MSTKTVNITKVEKSRWHEAQNYEREHWIEGQKVKRKLGKGILYGLLAKVGLKPRYRGDDYNLWWSKQFEDYSFLPASIENLIELGCGPYTNLRIIESKCFAKHIFLSDPLMETYYKFQQTIISDMIKGKRFLILDNHPLEKCPFVSNYFDVVIIINVLDHVQDAKLCMENAINLTKKDGYFILGQDLTNEEDLDLLKGNVGEIGHPIKLGHDWLDEILKEKFNPIIYKVLDRHRGRTNLHYGTYIYAGVKV